MNLIMASIYLITSSKGLIFLICALSMCAYRFNVFDFLIRVFDDLLKRFDYKSFYMIVQCTSQSPPSCSTLVHLYSSFLGYLTPCPSLRLNRLVLLIPWLLDSLPLTQTQQVGTIELVYIRLVKHTIDVGSMKVYLTVG